MSKTIHNLITGEVTQVALSAEEIAEYAKKFKNAL